ncbi:MAG: DUF5103 domain-containing protein [Microscillaceae bacterium]|nr:DUF5103 domain-containing protein [Microscillaceae bacterium]
MKKQYFLFLLLPLATLTGCLPLPNSAGTTTNPSLNEKVFTTENYVYEANVRTIQFCPEALTSDKSEYLKPPVRFLQDSRPLQIEFDLVGEHRIRNLRARVFHCDYDWKLSNLNDIEVLNEVNDFVVNNYQISFNTRVPYVHYTFQVPRVKMSGNYVLMIYQNGNDKDYLLTQRFWIYENKIGIEPNVRNSTQVSERDRNQQIDFKLNYSAYSTNLMNPREEIKVVIRQNYRSDNQILGLKPLYIREFDKLLEYNYFNLENNFRGGNEFRRFDTRSIRFLGFNVNNISVSDTLVAMQLVSETSREKNPYFRQPDYNGNYLIGHFETGRGKTEADYIQTKFVLQARQMADGEVYVVGRFNNWQTETENRMRYNAEKGEYTADILLKQGEYNYMFGVKKLGEKTFQTDFWEGSFQETENNYEIIVYHHPLGARTDLIVGYRQFSSQTTR